ncbi:MAG: DUF1365 family protein [Alphaproteobacteria bacterium]
MAKITHPHIAQHYFMTGSVFHKRHATAFQKKQHDFRYRHWCALWAMADKHPHPKTKKNKPAATNPSLPLNFFFKSIFQFYPKDCGISQDNQTTRNIFRQMQIWFRQELSWQPERLELITQGRVFFYVFNPVSFWLAYDKKNILRAIVTEVHNTYGEHHFYLLYKKKLKPIDNHDIFTAPKKFHVSPFYDRIGYYQFQFLHNKKKFIANIKLFSPDHQLELDTAMAMKKIPINNRNAWKILSTMPLQPYKVILTIHLHAVYLWIKKIGYRKKPPAKQPNKTHGFYRNAI